VKKLAVLALGAALALSLGGCGRKAAPAAPPDVDARYPRNYPSGVAPRPAAVNPNATPAPRAIPVPGPIPGPGNQDDFIPRTTP
jgi:hypothetical protein